MLFLWLDDAVRTAVRIAAYRPTLCGAAFLLKLATPAFGQATGGVQQEARPGGERRIPGINIFRQAEAFALLTVEEQRTGTEMLVIQRLAQQVMQQRMLVLPRELALEWLFRQRTAQFLAGPVRPALRHVGLVQQYQPIAFMVTQPLRID